MDCANIEEPYKVKVYNPNGITPGSGCSPTSHNKCAVGDLTGKFGAVNTVQLYPSSLTDKNLQLSGSKNIISKYLIIYNQTNVYACAKIHIYKHRTAKSMFNHDGIHGEFFFEQSSPFEPTKVRIHLQGLNNMAKGYHVHNFPVPLQTVKGEPLCSGTIVSGHLNPFHIAIDDEYPSPTNATDDLYETGDLSSKYGTLAQQSEFGPTNLSDWNLPLFGKNSIIGRSIVIHHNDAKNSRYACML